MQAGLHASYRSRIRAGDTPTDALDGVAAMFGTPCRFAAAATGGAPTPVRFLGVAVASVIFVFFACDQQMFGSPDHL